MAVLLFLIHRFRRHRWVLVESLLVASTNYQMLILVIFFEVELRWATLVYDSLDVLAIVSIDVRRYRCKDPTCITALASVLPFLDNGSPFQCGVHT